MSETPKLLAMTETLKDLSATIRGYVDADVFTISIHRADADAIDAVLARVQALEAENQRLTEALQQPCQSCASLAKALAQFDGVMPKVRDAPPTEEKGTE